MFPCSSCQYRFPTVNAPMSHMPDNNNTKSNDDNDAKPFIPKETPILVTLSATALGSLGFGLVNTCTKYKDDMMLIYLRRVYLLCGSDGWCLL